MRLVGLVGLVYIVGIIIGLLVMRDPWPVRIGTALAWPLGVLAFLVVAVILTAASVYLWPIPILATFALLTLGWLAIR